MDIEGVQKVIRKEDILTYIRQNKKQFQEHYHVTKIGLFGSFARDEQNYGSDIDLVIELEAGTENIHELKQELREIMQKKFNRSVEIAREKYLKTYVKETILHEAVYVE